MIVGGMFAFVFGGLTPIFTRNIGSMFIFIGLGFFLFICGGILTSVKMMRNRMGVNQNEDKEFDSFDREEQFTPRSYDSYGFYNPPSEYNSQSSAFKSNATDSSEALVCQYCGSVNKPGDKYCSTCGSQLR